MKISGTRVALAAAAGRESAAGEQIRAGVKPDEMACGWSPDATRALIGVWGEANIQKQLDGVARNKHVYEKISTSMRELGYEKTWEQCRTKVKNLTNKYRKVNFLDGVVW